MTAQQFLDHLRSIGGGVRVRHDGTPYFVGVKAEDAAAVKKAAAWHRAEILKIVPRDPDPAIEQPDLSRPIECRWMTGHECRHYFPEDGWPIGAGWWKYAGESDSRWRPIPEAQRLEAVERAIRWVRSGERPEPLEADPEAVGIFAAGEA